MFGLSECYLIMFVFLIICFTIFFSPVYDQLKENNNSRNGVKICQVLILSSYIFISMGVLYYLNRNDLSI